MSFLDLSMVQKKTKYTQNNKTVEFEQTYMYKHSNNIIDRYVLGYLTFIALKPFFFFKFWLFKPGAFSGVWREKSSVWHLLCWSGKQQIQIRAGIVAYCNLTYSHCSCSRIESYVNRTCCSKVFKCAVCLGGQDHERGDITGGKPLSPTQLHERGMIHPPT